MRRRATADADPPLARRVGREREKERACEGRQEGMKKINVLTQNALPPLYGGALPPADRAVAVVDAAVSRLPPQLT